MKHLTREELGLPDHPEIIRMVNQWLTRGDGIAVYENHDIGHPELGHRQFVSFGSNEALIEAPVPPERLPDIGNQINWRYQLIGVYEGEPFEEGVRFGTLLPNGKIANERYIKQSFIRECPYYIIMPEHYREDGTCRCNDPDHIEMQEWGYAWDSETERWS